MERQLCTQMSVWQQRYHNNVCHVVDVLINFGQMFALFWYFYRWLWILFVYCECYLMIYLCGKPKRGYIYGSSCKTLVSNSVNDKGVLQRYLSISCYDVIFNFYYYILGKLAQSINEI